MRHTTCDLYDAHEGSARVLPAQWQGFGRCDAFSGIAVTARCLDNNSVVKRLASQPGTGKVMVVDGGGSLNCALLGDMIARSAVDNGWQGVVVWGAVRDRSILETLEIGVKALGTTPRKSVRREIGDIDVPIEIAGVRVLPGDRVFADTDGVLVLAADVRVD